MLNSSESTRNSFRDLLTRRPRTVSQRLSASTRPIFKVHHKIGLAVTGPGKFAALGGTPTVQPVHVADLPRKSKPRWRRISEPGGTWSRKRTIPKIESIPPRIPGNIKRPVNINAQINLRCAASLWSGSTSDLGEFALCGGRRCRVREKFNERRLNSTTALWQCEAVAAPSGAKLVEGDRVGSRGPGISNELLRLPECA